MELDSTRAETTPRRFLSITMVYHVVGDVPQKLVERVVDKTLEKYCSVSASLNPEMVIDWCGRFIHHQRLDGRPWLRKASVNALHKASYTGVQRACNPRGAAIGFHASSTARTVANGLMA